jgi:hypothetical protein
MKNILVVMCLFVVGLSYSQKHDYQWIFGYDNQSFIDSTADSLFGGSIVDFRQAPPLVTKHIRGAAMDEDDISFCDADGNLLFYSNGDAVFDRRDSVMSNGDSISYSWWWDFWLYPAITNAPQVGLTIPQGMLALPKPRDSTKVYLCHYINNESDFPNGYGDVPCDSSFYSIIDLLGNNGYGQVITKNILLTGDTLAASSFSAVKHGNGTDWWILHPYWQGSNCIYEFLATETGIDLYAKQCLGPIRTKDGALGTSCFSPNGDKYFWVNAVDGIRMFDFDRCTGILSNPSVIPFPFSSFADSVTLIAGVAVSPSGRYLYIVSSIIVLQYDLQATNIGTSVDTVAAYDGYYDPAPPFRTNFFWAQLGPDGKIYINSTDGVPHLHVINRPDMAGDSCLFKQHSFNLLSYNGNSLPNFPNYRLGALTGSACDTISTLSADLRAEKEKNLKIFPNPTNDMVTIDYGFTDWNKGEVSLEIANQLGQVVYTQKLPMYSGYQRIDVSKFANGLYTAFIKRQNTVVATAKFVKE